MRCVFSSFLFIMCFSCSNPLDNAYNPITLEKDIDSLKEIISENELNELVDYIELTSSLGVDIYGKTYNDLINELKQTKINNEIIPVNTLLLQDVQELINERLEQHNCDDFIIQAYEKEMHEHNDEKDDLEIWTDDNYFMDY